MSTVTTPELSRPLAAPRERFITLRSVLLGLCGVVIICAVAPYNDYALNNTFFIGNNLPLGLMALMLVLVVFNGALNRFVPRWALSSGELAVCFSMALVSATLPTSGLLRYLAPALVTPFYHAAGNAEYLNLLERLDLPAWIYPRMAGQSVRERISDPIVTGFWTRWIEDAPLPYAAWLQPICTWGLFLAALYGALFCLVTIVRRQWFENERLAFPLAQIQLALIERPAPGHWFNAMLGARGFWIAFTIVMLIRLWNGSAVYWPTYFSEIPMGFDLTGLLSEAPLSHVSWHAKVVTIYLIVVGVAYFLSTPVAFSLWAFFLFDQLRRMLIGTATADPENPGAWDEHIGAVLAFAVMVLYLGRAHWLLVIRQALRGERPGEPAGRYLSYPVAFWGFIGCFLFMCAWLVAAGCTLLGAVVVVSILLMLFMIITRIIAETGLVYGQLLFPLYRPWQYVMHYTGVAPVPTRTFFHAGILQVTFYDFREPLPVYATHALKVSESVIDPADLAAGRRRGRRFLGLLVLALVVGYFVAWGSTIWTNYSFAATLDVQQVVPINTWGTSNAQTNYLLGPSLAYQNNTLNLRHSPLMHVGGGFLFTGALALLKARLAWWPLHPVGFLMTHTSPVQKMWFSLLLGWAVKVIIVKYGGARMYQSAKPVFLGLILGDTMAAGLWLGISMLLHLSGIDFHPIRIMPG